MTKTLLWLDDLRDPTESDWKDWLSKYSPIDHPIEVAWVKSYDEFTGWIKANGLPDGICFDHDLGEGVAKKKVSAGMSKKKARQEKKDAKTGKDCANWLVKHCMDNRLKLPAYNIQSANAVGRENINGLLLSFLKNVSFE